MNKNNAFTLDSTGCLSQDDTKRYYSRIGFFYLILAGTSFLISTIAATVITLFFPWIAKNEIYASIANYAISLVGIYLISMPLASIMLKPLPSVKPLKEKMKFKHLFGALCICFCFMLTGSYFSMYLQDLIQLIKGGEIQNNLEETLSMGDIILNILCVGILFPILEELLFRKLLCNKLLPLGEKQAVIISAAIFGFIHGNIFQFLYAFLVGLVFGYIYVKSGKIIYSIIFHCVINLFTGIFASFVASLPITKVLEELLMDESILYKPELIAEAIEPYMLQLPIYLFYSYALMGLSVAGFVIFFILTIKRRITFEQGILPPAKEHAVGNFFLTTGVAGAVAFTAFKFIYSFFI